MSIDTGQLPTGPPRPPPLDLQEHFDLVSPRVRAGKVIPFLGAGANLCGRPAGCDWLEDHYLPTGTELAEYLARDYPLLADETRDLSRISQYVDLFGGDAVLFEKLRELFAGDYEPNQLHHLLAAVPGAAR